LNMRKRILEVLEKLGFDYIGIGQSIMRILTSNLSLNIVERF